LRQRIHVCSAIPSFLAASTRLLREAEIIESKGLTQVEAAKKLGIAEQTLIRWRKEYGGLRVDQARRFKELENIRLKRLVADLSLDKAILKDAASGNL